MHGLNKLLLKMVFYFSGLAIMAVGVVLSVKSDMGVTPISSIPYTKTVVFGMDLGLATIIFSVLMVVLQVLILRSRYQLKDLLQLPIGIIFGLALTLFGKMMTFSVPDDFMVKFILMLVSTVFVAFGVFLYVSSGFIPLAPEGFIIAVCKVTKKKFPTIKVIFDVTMVVISLLTCLLMIRSFGSIGIGTIVAALLVGNEVKFFTKTLGAKRNRILGLNAE